MGKSQSFRFDGGAGSYLAVGIMAVLITLVTLGFGVPWAVTMQQRWKAKHTMINGVRLEFRGSGAALLGNWVKWLLLTFVTLGIYSFWVMPRLQKWIVENTDFAPHGQISPQQHGQHAQQS